MKLSHTLLKIAVDHLRGGARTYKPGLSTAAPAQAPGTAFGDAENWRTRDSQEGYQKPATAPTPAAGISFGDAAKRDAATVGRGVRAVGNALDFQAPAERDTFNAKTQKHVPVTTPQSYVRPGLLGKAQGMLGYGTAEPRDASSVPFGAKTAPADVERTPIDKMPRFGSPADRAMGAHGVMGRAGAHGDTHRPEGTNEEIMYNQRDQAGKLQPHQVSTYGGRPASVETLSAQHGSAPTPFKAPASRPYTAPSTPMQEQQNPWAAEQVQGAGKREIARQNTDVIAKQPKY